ncbi:response regulator transcription factor [bacterium]|nr:response regulator transcription factor [bacterium]
MNEFRAVIVDDERMAISALEHEICLFLDHIEIVGTATSLKDAVSKIDSLKPNLLFLDIQLSEGLGFDILEQLQHRDFHLIFTTAYEDYAIEAFKVDAFDYLLKPISGEDIVKSLQRLQERKGAMRSNLLLQQDKLTINSSGETLFVNIADIIHCASVGNYTRFHFKDDSKILVPKTLKEIEEKLEAFGFLRVHKSHLVNMNYATKLRTKELQLVLKDDSTLPVSHRRKTLLNSYFENL